MQDILQGQKEESEIAIFWQEIGKNLPKSQEMSALGTKPVFIAFKAAYPSIKQYLSKQIIQALIEKEKAEKKSVLPNVLDGKDDKTYYEHGIDGVKGYNQAKQDTISHLKQLLDNLQ